MHTPTFFAAALAACFRAGFLKPIATALLIFGLPLGGATSALAQTGQSWAKVHVLVVSQDSAYQQQAQALLAPWVQTRVFGSGRRLEPLAPDAVPAAINDAGLYLILLDAASSAALDSQALATSLSAQAGARHVVMVQHGTTDARNFASSPGLDIISLKTDNSTAAVRAIVFEQLRRALSGYADAAPFGNADDTITNAELVAYLARSIRVRLKDPTLVMAADLYQPQGLLNLPQGVEANVADRVALKQEQLQAQTLIDSDTAGAQMLQDYFNACVFCPLSQALAAKQNQLVEAQAQAQAEQSIYERYVAEGNVAGLRGLLSACSLCEFRDEALVQIAELEAQAERDADKAAFDSAQDVVALEAYLTSCQLCGYETQAKEKIAVLKAQADDKRRFVLAKDAGSLEALQTYVDSCDLCAFRQDADLLMAQLASSPQALAEEDTWLDAKQAGLLDGIQAYLDDCQVCRYRLEAQELRQTVQDAEDFARLVTPCFAQAAAPQYGGPALGALDTGKARAACAAAQDRFPGNMGVRAALARAVLASGRYEDATTTLAPALEAGEPTALGLGAYMAYFDLPGQAADWDKAATWAQQGKDKGDHTASLIWTFLAQSGVLKVAQADIDATLETLAQDGSTFGQYLLALRLEPQVNSNDAAAARQVGLLQQASAAGHLDARAMLAAKKEQALFAGDAAAAGETALDATAVMDIAQLYLSAYEGGSLEARKALIDQGRERPQAIMQSLQTLLAEEGHYDLTIDGLFGPGTQQAFERALQARHFGGQES